MVPRLTGRGGAGSTIAANTGTSGWGANSYFGIGGQAIAINDLSTFGAGAVGTRGAGGSGAISTNNANSANGGNGGGGYVRIIEYF